MIKNIILGMILLSLVIFSCTKIVNYSWDITENNSNSLSASTKQLLDNLTSNVHITVHSPNMFTINVYQKLLTLYKNYSPYITYTLENNTISPKDAGQLNVYTDNVLIAAMQHSKEAIDIQNDSIAEQQISSLIQQAINDSNNWVAFLTGHNEADISNTEEFGLSKFADLLKKQGLNIAHVNLTQNQNIAKNTGLLIVVNPQQELLPYEQVQLHEYIAKGGNILWFTEPDAPITSFIAEEFGIKPSKGVIIDPDSIPLGSPHPALKLINKYAEHTITNNLSSTTLLPWSAHLQILYEANNWQATPFLTTSSNTWSYYGETTTDLARLAKFKEHLGPLNIGIALAKDKQHAVIISDSTFITNKYLPLYANSQLLTNILSFTHNKNNAFIYSPPALKDVSYQPSKYDLVLYQYIFTIVCPLLLFSIGYFTTRPKNS